MARQRPLRLKGVEKVMKNLNREIKGIKNRSMKGLIESAILIRRDMEVSPPLIPVDTGNLRASWFVTTGYGNMAADSGNFKGKQAGEMSQDHSRVISKASGQAKAVRQTNNPILIMGFSANYAAAVHERTTGKKGKKIEFKKEGSGPNFFGAALNRNKATIITLIAKNAKRS